MSKPARSAKCQRLSRSPCFKSNLRSPGSASLPRPWAKRSRSGRRLREMASREDGAGLRRRWARNSSSKGGSAGPCVGGCCSPGRILNPKRARWLCQSVSVSLRWSSGRPAPRQISPSSAVRPGWDAQRRSAVAKSSEQMASIHKAAGSFPRAARIFWCSVSLRSRHALMDSPVLVCCWRAILAKAAGGATEGGRSGAADGLVLAMRRAPGAA